MEIVPCWHRPRPHGISATVRFIHLINLLLLCCFKDNSIVIVLPSTSKPVRSEISPVSPSEPVLFPYSFVQQQSDGSLPYFAS